MLRDTLKTKAFFDEWIAYDQERIRIKQDLLDTDGIALLYGRVGTSYDLFNKALDVVVMRFSRGDALADLRGDVLALLDAREQLKARCDALPQDEQGKRVQYERLSFDNYLDALWWLSFGVCLQMDQAYLTRVLAVIGGAGKDALLDRIAVRIGDVGRPVGDTLLFPKQYGLLLQAIDAPADAQPKLMKKFLDGWYKGNRTVAAWYGNHTGEDTGYVGYWCFEAALVVRLFGIDDAAFRTHIHYPADLAAHA